MRSDEAGLRESVRGCPFGMDLGSAEFNNHFHSILEELRTTSPVAADLRSDNAYLVTRYEDVWSVLQDWRTYSSADGVAGTAGSTKLLPMDSDPPHHTRWRALLNPLFTRQRMSRLEDQVVEHARNLLSKVPTDGTVDLIESYCQPLPALAFLTEIMELDAKDLDDCMSHVERAVASPSPEESQQGYAALGAFVTDLVNRLSQEPPSDNVMSTVTHATFDGVPAPVEEKISVGMMLLLGGLETSSNTLASLLRHLISNPDHADEARRDPVTLTSVVEEGLRMFAPTTYLRRTVRTDTELHGVPLSVGDQVLVSYAAANYDRVEFDDPDRFDPTRTPNRHVAFGVGIHRCLGSNLARVILTAGVREFLEAGRSFELTGPGTYHSVPTRGLHDLTVKITNIS